MKKTIKQVFVGTLAVGAFSLPFQAAASELSDDDFNNLTRDEYRNCSYAAFNELEYKTKRGDRVIEGVNLKTGRVHFAHAALNEGEVDLTDAEMLKLCSKDANGKGCYSYGYGFGTDQQIAGFFDEAKEECLVDYVNEKKELLRKKNELYIQKEVSCFFAAFKELGYNTVTRGAVVVGTHRTTGRKAFGEHPDKIIPTSATSFEQMVNESRQYMIDMCAPYSPINACNQHGDFHTPAYRDGSPNASTALYNKKSTCQNQP